MTARILIVEDNLWLREMLEVLVDRFGYESRVAKDGREGVQAALEFKPDLILMDLQMPRMDGFESLAKIRESDLPRMPIVAVTTSGLIIDRERFVKAGFDGYILKPIDPRKLQHQIERYIDADLRAPPLEI